MTWDKQWTSEKKSDHWQTPDPDVIKFMKNNSNLGDKKVLDYGCGIGRHSILFTKSDFDVTAIDVSENALKHLEKWAKEENCIINIAKADLDDKMFDNEKFDIILSYNVIYHGYRKDVQEKLKKIRKILNKNGKLYFTIPTREDGKYGFGKKLAPHTYLCDKSIHKGDIHYFSDKNDIKKLLKEFQIIDIKKDEHYWQNDGKKQFSSYWKIICG
ncbi:MAG: class I SAM-dependent methyltransferase [Parcubacteria group bacterium]|nr:class I SAM-dependent methyltransferase [Parcubacteria group bacterium]